MSKSKIIEKRYLYSHWKINEKNENYHQMFLSLPDEHKYELLRVAKKLTIQWYIDNFRKMLFEYMFFLLKKIIKIVPKSRFNQTHWRINKQIILNQNGKNFAAYNNSEYFLKNKFQHQKNTIKIWKIIQISKIPFFTIDELIKLKNKKIYN